MAREVYRILALGEGEVVDRTAANLTTEGYAVAQVDDRKQARRLLKAGDFDLVVADGASRVVTDLMAEAGDGRPWILLGKAEGRSATPSYAVRLTPPVTTEALVERIQTLVAESRAAAGGKRARARVAGASRTTG